MRMFRADFCFAPGDRHRAGGDGRQPGRLWRHQPESSHPLGKDEGDGHGGRRCLALGWDLAGRFEWNDLVQQGRKLFRGRVWRVRIRPDRGCTRMTKETREQSGATTTLCGFGAAFAPRWFQTKASWCRRHRHGWGHGLDRRHQRHDLVPRTDRLRSAIKSRRCNSSRSRRTAFAASRRTPDFFGPWAATARFGNTSAHFKTGSAWDAGEWIQTPASGIADVAADESDPLWLTGKNGSVWKSGNGKDFEQVAPPGSGFVSIGAGHGAVYAVLADGSLWRYKP